MKIFISHSSLDVAYGGLLVELLRGVGLKEHEIIFTSNVAYGIPAGHNIFHWLKSQISEKPFVIYLLSKNYYSSIACLNEMGAAWIVENKHAALFTPDFDLESREFRSGAIDPREIAFCVDNEERMMLFIHQLSEFFEISKSPVIVNQQIKAYLRRIDKLKNGEVTLREELKIEVKKIEPVLVESVSDIKSEIKTNNPISKGSVVTKITSSGLFNKFEKDVLENKLKSSELLMFHYIIETGRVKLLTGWQAASEIEKIVLWEDTNELNNELSQHYLEVLSRFEVRGYTTNIAHTASGNVKEVSLKPELSEKILDLPQPVLDIIENAVANNGRSQPNNESHFLI